MRGRLLCALLLLGCSSGCSYGFVHYRGTLGQARTLAIHTPSNESMEPGLEQVMAEALRREALRRGGLRLVGSGADLVLDGAVLPLAVEQTSVSSVLLALEYRVSMSVQLRALGRDGTPLLSEPILVSESDRYLANPDVEILRKSRAELLRRLSSLLAERCFDALYEALAHAEAPAAAGG